MSSNPTAGFIDLATYDELEKYMYGGPDATAYFVRETRKSTWFTQVPVLLNGISGTPGFGNKWSVTISRVGDYLLQAWLRLTLGAFTVAADGVGTVVAASSVVRWTRNFMHALISECTLDFNGLIADKFDNFNLDFWAAFAVPANKQTGYDNMIGNVANVTGSVLATGSSTATVLNLPLPFFFSRDSGVALPTAALPYNDMKIHFTFRPASELICHQNATSNAYIAYNATDYTTLPTMTDIAVWGNYAIVSNDERKRMACAPRDILIEQYQTQPKKLATTALVNDTTDVSLRFVNDVKCLMFGCRNIAATGGINEWGNYSTGVPDWGGALPAAGVLPTFPTGLTTQDPIAAVSLIYENTNRFNLMGADYFSLTQPYYQPGASVPTAVGYHLYSYSLDFLNVDPMGSTNYGKLQSVTLTTTCTAAAAAATGTFDLHVLAVSNNIVRIAGGALGFPVL